MTVAGATLLPRRVAGRTWVAIGGLLAVLAALACFNLLRGEPNVGLADVWSAIFTPDDISTNPAHFLIRQLRIPRVLVGVICGGALGLAGVLLQDSLRNPLADPGLLGVAQGASLVVALATIYPEVTPPLPLPVLCLIAGSVTGTAVIVMSGSHRDPVRLILVGAMTSAFFGTITTAVILLAPYDRSLGIVGYTRFVIGSASAAEWETVRTVLPWFLVGAPLALLSGRTLNLLQLGDETAAGMGLNPVRARMLLLALSMVLIAPVIATIGPIGFIALFAPHVSRGLLVSTNARPVLIVSALAGATLLLAADTVGRLLFFPVEIPAGIWAIAIIGPLAILVVGRLGRRAQA